MQKYEITGDISRDFPTITKSRGEITYKKPDIRDKSEKAFQIMVRDPEEERNVLFVEGYLFDEERYDDPEEMATYASDVSVDVSYGINRLVRSKVFKTAGDVEGDTGVIIWNSAVVYLHHVYVSRAYRKKGFGHWIFRALPDIIYDMFDYNVRYFTIAPVPMDLPYVEDPSDNSSDQVIEDPDMKKQMIKVIEDNGFRIIPDQENEGRSDYYFKEYDVTSKK